MLMELRVSPIGIKIIILELVTSMLHGDLYMVVIHQMELVYMHFVVIWMKCVYLVQHDGHLTLSRLLDHTQL